jgi:hypothetical protein
MAVGFFVDPIFYKIGTGDFLNSFFSTVYVKLENFNWGSRYPIIMNELYNGAIRKEKINAALIELEDIKNNLAVLSPKDVVWDFENLEALPPWGDNISSDITNLSNYFVTSDGDDLLYILKKAMKTSVEIDEDLVIRSI